MEEIKILTLPQPKTNPLDLASSKVIFLPKHDQSQKNHLHSKDEVEHCNCLTKFNGPRRLNMNVMTPWLNTFEYILFNQHKPLPSNMEFIAPIDGKVWTT